MIRPFIFDERRAAFFQFKLYDAEMLDGVVTLSLVPP